MFGYASIKPFLETNNLLGECVCGWGGEWVWVCGGGLHVHGMDTVATILAGYGVSVCTSVRLPSVVYCPAPLPGVIRAHQCKEEGVGFAYADNREETFTFPYITTLFSASNYCGTHGNKAALLVFYEDDVQVCVCVGSECVSVCGCVHLPHPTGHKGHTVGGGVH